MQNRAKQVAKTLQFFYDNPIAAVSVELFLTAGLILFLGISAIRPTLLTMSDLLKEIDDKKSLSEKLNQKVATLATAQTEYLAQESRLYLLDQAIPPNPQVIDALKIIEKVASEQRVAIGSISINKVPDDLDPGAMIEAEIATTSAQTNSVALVPISITINGDYVSIRKFVETLQNNRRSFVVETVAFGTDENRGAKSLQASLVVNLPYFAKTEVVMQSTAQ
jgi:Tfp pilus assembly protein PilO